VPEDTKMSLSPSGREMMQAVLRHKNVFGHRVSGLYTEGWPTGLQEREDDFSEATMKVAYSESIFG
jgi:hypothetical protein